MSEVRLHALKNPDLSTVDSLLDLQKGHQEIRHNGCTLNLVCFLFGEDPFWRQFEAAKSDSFGSIVVV